MTDSEWYSFCKFKNEYKDICINILKKLGFEYCMPKIQNKTAVSTCKNKNNISNLQVQAAHADGTPFYNVETPIVYNHSWDDVVKNDSIKLILIGDNPGKNEQLHKNQRYLVGQAGKLADNFFKNHKEFKIDFRKNVIILNKTPIHSAKTKELNFILKNTTDKSLIELFEYSQIITAQKTFELQQELDCPIWLVGYGELHEKGIFSLYANKLRELYYTTKKKKVYVFQHFSMNRFSIDLKLNSNPKLSVIENVNNLGLKHRNEILNF